VKRSLIVRDVYDLSYFTEDELETANAFKLQKRSDEWLLARFAAKQLALELGIVDDPRKCSIARPMLIVDGAPVNWFVSISHSAPYAAAAIAREPVGIDIQMVRDLSENAAHLFLSDREAEAMRRCTLPRRLLHFWSAKEAAWKSRSTELTTLKQLPIEVIEERASGLRFDVAETMAIEDVILGITHPTS
jgi:phosphopantetheine--protein transferase-like protein